MLEELLKSGIDTDDALCRCMGNKALLEKLYKAFPETVRNMKMQEKFENGDFSAALSGAHLLKGMTGNLSMTVLFEGYSEIVSLLRDLRTEEAFEKYKKILPVQEEIIKITEKYI